MNRKQFIMLLLVLAVVGGAGLVLVRQNQQSWMAPETKAGDKVLPGFNINDVADIHIRGAGSDFNIIHTNDRWCIRERDNYPADFRMIRDFLFRLRDLKVVQSDPIGPAELAHMDLNPPEYGTNAATVLEFKNEHGKLIASLIAGKKHLRTQNDQEPAGLHGLFDGRYLLLPGDPHNVLLVSDDLGAASPNPGLWFSPDFFKAENVKFISLASPDPGESWEISRPDASSPWTLDNPRPGEVLNAKMAGDIGEILAFPTFDDVTPKTSEHLARLGLDQPIVVTVLTDYFAYTLKIGHRGADGDYPLTVGVAANIPDTDVNAPALREKLAQEKTLASWIYDAGSWIERVLPGRSTLAGQTPMETAGQ
jgi:hypothetical protein